MADIKTMSVEELETRLAAIPDELDAEGADLDALETEVRSINEELETRRNAAARREEIRNAVAGGAGTVIETIKTEEDKPMTLDEIRSSHEYNVAYANYIKTGKDEEVRALLSTNAPADGTVPVATYLEQGIRTAWERSGLLDLVRKTYVRGNVAVGFELSATGAAVHEEGTDAPNEETLTLGVVTIIAKSIKKWIRVSDEVADLGGEEFLDYVRDELAYRIALEAKRLLIAQIAAAPAAATATAVGVPTITGAPTLAIVAQAVANLSDEASDITVVMNRLTHADFIAAIAANGYLFDPFDGYRVVYDNTLPAYTAATAGQDWLIVGDFRLGAMMNFPNGEEIRVKYDDLTEAEADLIKLVGRMYVGIGLVADKAFATVTKGN